MAGKSDIVEVVADRVEGLTKKQAAEAVDAVVEAIRENLTEGERVVLPGFGSFSVTERAARMGRNPSTGEKINIPASRSAQFKPGKELKASVSRSGLDGGSTTDPP